MKLDVCKIEVLMANAGMSKSALADKSGISRQSISTIVRRGTCEPITAGKIAAGLGVPVQSLIGGDANRAEAL